MLGAGVAGPVARRRAGRCGCWAPTVLFTALAYLFTPLTAAGEEGQPIAFVWNVRYIAPAVAIALAIASRACRRRDATARRRLLRHRLGLSVLLAVDRRPRWSSGTRAT